MYPVFSNLSSSYSPDFFSLFVFGFFSGSGETEALCSLRFVDLTVFFGDALAAFLGKALAAFLGNDVAAFFRDAVAAFFGDAVAAFFGGAVAVAAFLVFFTGVDV